MNKLLKTTLVSAIMATSGFATQQDGGTISGLGYIEQGAIMEMEANIKANMENKAVIHNYSIIQGPAATAEDGTKISMETAVGEDNKAMISGLDTAKKAVIQGTESEKIINYDHIMEKDTEFAGLNDFEIEEPTYFRPTGGGKIQGAVDTTDVTVTSDIADLERAIFVDGHNDSADVMLLTTSCQETDKTMRLTNTEDDMKTVNANIANEIAEGGGNSSHSLVVRGKFRFEGDQSRFNQEDTTLKFSKSHSEIATPKSLFMRPIDVLNKSELVIDAKGVEMPHDVTVMNSQFIVNPKASFTIKQGAKLSLKRVPGYPSEEPLTMIWEDGSFANELTLVNKNYYEETFNDGTSLKFYYDEDRNYWEQVYDESSGGTDTEHDYFQFNETDNGGLEIGAYIYKSIKLSEINDLSCEERDGTTYYTVPLQYDQSIEIYEDPENAGQYKTDAEGYNINSWGDSIKISKYNVAIKTLSAEDISNLVPYQTELIYAHDDVFSYNYDETNNSWVRRAQFAFSGPGNPDEWLNSDNHISGKKIFVFDEAVNNVKFFLVDVNHSTTSPLCWIYSYDEGTNKIGYIGTYHSAFILLEGTNEAGLFARRNNWDDKNLLSAIDNQLKEHSYAKSWYNLLSEYNAEHGTDYPELS